jgi:hypothetical protein
MKQWNEDEDLLESLDNWLKNSERDLKIFLTILNRYSESLDLVSNALIFGVLGKITVKYNKFRENNSIQESLILAFKEAQDDSRVKELIQQSVQTAIDSKVETLKEAQ